MSSKYADLMNEEPNDLRCDERWKKCWWLKVKNVLKFDANKPFKVQMSFKKKFKNIYIYKYVLVPGVLF